MKLEEAIDKAWANLRERVEFKCDLNFDHEFTLQFHLAWEVARLFNFSDSLNVRFEVPCGKDADGETIRLDLLLWTDTESKVAVELKAPMRSDTGKGSAMTQSRMRFYRDIHRLRHLVATHHVGVRLGMFLAVVNEKGYVVERNQHVNRDYRTYHGTVLAPGVRIAATTGTNGYPHELLMPGHEIRWTWTCEQRGGEVQLCDGMRYYWLEPVFVRAVRTA
ncbi:MAG: hypothetical protein LKG23_05370 [Nitrospira sp.]|jgi:hypothetical protein|nr:hypothetical protein [Nitrospira sp.]